MSVYCSSRFSTIRRASREVFIGDLGVGAENPIRIQSMTTTNTQDVSATVKQAIALAESGCEIVRITAPNKPAARALKDIRSQFRAAGFETPLVADIHFLPSAAMEAVEHVEKVRINPGNYADKKKFSTREYTNDQYEKELKRLHEGFPPLVLRSKELGRAMRIGTNHGSLSDRIMNRYGDTPLGMVESALEFLRIAELHSYRDIILSMKASNPKVMIEAYRLLVDRMNDEGMTYPLHLGVTEAGDGEDGRIKSAIGIGSLLMDGLGDTIRVSLTEDPVFEIPVAQALVKKVMANWRDAKQETEKPDTIDPYHFQRRSIATFELTPEKSIGIEEPPTVITKTPFELTQFEALETALSEATPKLKDTPIEGLCIAVQTVDQLQYIEATWKRIEPYVSFLVLEIPQSIDLESLSRALTDSKLPLALIRDFDADALTPYKRFLGICSSFDAIPIVGLTPNVSDGICSEPANNLIVTLNSQTRTNSPKHRIGSYRHLANRLQNWQNPSPLWIRNSDTGENETASFLNRLLDASILSGSLLCDGLGDLISIETDKDLTRATKLTYNVLQGTGARISKTEFVACPSCGRTLFDLQSTTQRIRGQTGHLKGVKIAIMGCIVNGPGEMADADFGYVGGAPAKINLYVGKNCVRYNIPQAEADQHLIDLIKEHGKWVDPETVEA
ncbi:MAG: (E)-4-hydroxy-3-methylbut-2-enyl-diphosphate synthase [Opitutales bacterium]|nr:(E)-4-hydroxy-3-methylbut-2-enyl-diphosphate synthase [Opitutales bacterium]